MGSAAEQVDVVVIGSGWNGLISAKTYLDFEPSASLVIVDKGLSIGGVWSTEQIYPNLYAQTTHGLFEYSFYPMRREGLTKDGYISAETINAYLNDFARDYDLVRRTRLRTTVSQVSRTVSGGWRLEIAGGTDIECGKLVYASGATSHPIIPTWPTDNFNAPIIHSCDTGSRLSPDLLSKVQSATVVGGSKSSFDSVFLLLQAGKKVDWIIREGGCGPMAIMPPTLLTYTNTMDVMTSRFMAMMGVCILSTENVGYWFLQRTILGRFISWIHWLLVNWLGERAAGYSRSENAKKLRPAPNGSGVFWAVGGLGLASVPRFWELFHRGGCTVHRTDIVSLRDNKVNLKKGDSLATDCIVLCTGFDKSYHDFGEELQQQCGLIPDPAQADRWAELDAKAAAKIDELFPVLKDHPFGDRDFSFDKTAGGKKLMHGPSRHFRRLVVPKLAAQGDRSIAFPGFIHTAMTATVGEVQALWSVAFLLGLIDLPSQEEMEQEVAEWNVWTRKRYHGQGRRHAYAIYDFLPYIDSLLRDLGVNPQRKKTWLALFEPSYPREWKGIVQEFRQVLAKRQEAEGFASGALMPVPVKSEAPSPCDDGLSKASLDSGHRIKPLGFA